LHVLSLPPAFVLSQDQTLKLKRPLCATASGYLSTKSATHGDRILDERTSAHPSFALPPRCLSACGQTARDRQPSTRTKSHLSDACSSSIGTGTHQDSEADTRIIGTKAPSEPTCKRPIHRWTEPPAYPFIIQIVKKHPTTTTDSAPTSRSATASPVSGNPRNPKPKTPNPLPTKPAPRR
jgi:hypothetical protein